MNKNDSGSVMNVKPNKNVVKQASKLEQSRKSDYERSVRVIATLRRLESNTTSLNPLSATSRGRVDPRSHF